MGTVPDILKDVLRPRFVLLAGFGGLLLFLLAAAGRTLVLLDRVRDTDRRLRQSFVERLGELERIRSQIYLSGTYVRDYLLSPDDTGAEPQRDRLAGIESETRAELDRYAVSLDPGEREAFLALRGEIDAYWQIMQTTFDWNRAQRDRLRYTFFYEQLVPRRTTMLQIADQIGTINQRGLAKAEERFAASAGEFRSSLIVSFVIALVGGALLAVATILTTLRLESEVARRGDNLRDLSASLERAQEEERRKLARELHDEVGQSLSAILMEAGNANDADSSVEIREHVQAIAAQAGKTLQVVRDLALLLRPSMLDDLGLIPALNWQAREMAKRTGVDIRVDATGDLDGLPDTHRTCVYRVVQEALNNVARHAKARSARVSVALATGSVTFSVRDDGCGFDRRAVHGLGILGMEERVQRLGGRIRIEATPSKGTWVVAELPTRDNS